MALGGGVRGRRIGCPDGRTALSGPSLSPPRGRIMEVMSPCSWMAYARTFWPLVAAVMPLHVSLIVFGIVRRDLLSVFRVACVGRLQWKAEARAPDGRLLSRISAGWYLIAASQQRRPLLPLGARGAGMCCSDVAPLWRRRGGFSGEVSAFLSCPQENQTCLGTLTLTVLLPSSLSFGRAWISIFPFRFLLGLPPLGFTG